MSGVYQDVKREVEKVLCSVLKERTQIEFFPNKGKSVRETPFGAVMCESAKPLLGGKGPQAYRCEVKVVYVSNIDEAETEEHSRNVAKIEDTLSLIPQLDVEDYWLRENHIKVAGLNINDMQESSEDQSFGDVFVCTLGVVGINLGIETNECDIIKSRRPAIS